MKLSETYSQTLDIVDSGHIICNLTVTEGLLQQHEEEATFLFSYLQEKIGPVWKQLIAIIPENRWITLTTGEQKALNLSVILLNNEEIHNLNKEFRGKDSPTDVLTFNLLDETPSQLSFDQLPELDLGEIYLSITWARDHVCKQIHENEEQALNFWTSLSLFILERLVHGCLHLLGIHHDTMSAYNKVVEIQRRVVHAIT